MTPCYEATVVVTGLSTNNGAFREEIQSSTRRWPGDARTHEDLRREFVQGARDYLYEHETRPWRPQARYEGIANLVIEVGEIRTVGEF